MCEVITENTTFGYNQKPDLAVDVVLCVQGKNVALPTAKNA